MHGIRRHGLRARVLVGAALAAVGTWGSAAAQLPGQDPAAAQALAAALLEVELALKGRPPGPGRIAEVNRAFDQASLAFFAGRVDAVVGALAALVEDVEPDAEVRSRHRHRAQEILAGLPAQGRVLDVPGAPPVPYRLHGPSAAGEHPLPVVVALHGAGGNEHMFLEAYGAGRIRDLADERGFVVVSPSTTALARAPEAFPALLDAAAAAYPIDRGRVYLVGHSMGAGVAWGLAERYAGLVSAVACIAGGCGTGAGPVGAESLPPLLLVAGALDPIAAPSRVEDAAVQARARGIRVTYRLVPDQGHTLVVGAVLDDVVSWLLQDPARPPDAGR